MRAAAARRVISGPGRPRPRPDDAAQHPAAWRSRMLLLLLLGPPSSQQWPIQIAQGGGEAKGVWDAVDTSPDLGGQMSSKPPKWNHGKFSFAGFISIYVRKYFAGPLTGGGAIAPIVPYPHGSATGSQ